MGYTIQCNWYPDILSKYIVESQLRFCYEDAWMLLFFVKKLQKQ